MLVTRSKLWCSLVSVQMTCTTNHCGSTGKGVDIILDCIGGQNWEQNVSCLALDGRWVLYGTMGGRTVEGGLLGKLLARRGHLLSSLLRSRSLQVRESSQKWQICSFLHVYVWLRLCENPVVLLLPSAWFVTSSWLSALTLPPQYKAEVVKAFSHRALPHFSDQTGSLRPVIDRMFSLEHIAEAHRHMEANKNMGKIVVNVMPQSEKTQWWTAAETRFHGTPPREWRTTVLFKNVCLAQRLKNILNVLQ